MSEEIEKAGSAKPEPVDSSTKLPANAFGNRNFNRETTINIIAIFYLLAFFATIGAGFFVGLHNGFDIKDYKEMLLAISGILSGPLGFIIGYCFKSNKD